MGRGGGKSFRFCRVYEIHFIVIAILVTIEDVGHNFIEHFSFAQLFAGIEVLFTE